jgi:hypothetical protein
MNYLIALLTPAVFAFLLGYLFGHKFGYDAGEKTGRALEWCDNYFAEAKKDRARRDAQRRFK